MNRFLGLLGLVVSVIALGVTAAPASASIKLGVYVASDGQVGAPEDAQVLDSYAAMVGRKPDIVMDYSNLTDPLLTKTEVTNLQTRGETPLISWQLYKSGWEGSTISLADIAAGKYDSYIKAAADQARGLPFSEIMLRFGHEMNGNWYGWSGDPTNFVAAWRHVVSVFRAEGANNVKFVWSANVDNGSYPFAAYFPGDDYVDYTALDGYNWGTAGIGVNRWQTLEQVFSSSYTQLTQLSTKPVILTETASSEAGGDKAAWIKEGFLKTIPQKFPRVSAVVWFDRNKEEDWRIDSSPASLNAYREVVASSLYGGANPPPATEPEVTVESLEVTPTETVPAPVTSEPKKKKGGKKLTRQISYRLNARAAVRISVTTAARAGASSKLSLMISQPRLNGKVDLSRLLDGRTLRRGAYVVTATAIDSSGLSSQPRHAHFRVVPPAHGAGALDSARALG
jgi:endoglucanase